MVWHLRKSLHTSFSIRHLRSIFPVVCFCFSVLQPAPPVTISQWLLLNLNPGYASDFFSDVYMNVCRVFLSSRGQLCMTSSNPSEILQSNHFTHSHTFVLIIRCLILHMNINASSSGSCFSGSQSVCLWIIQNCCICKNIWLSSHVWQWETASESQRWKLIPLLSCAAGIWIHSIICGSCKSAQILPGLQLPCFLGHIQYY